MIRVPSYLTTGDTIGIVCPAGYMPFEKAATCIRTLEDWGFKVITGKTLGNDTGNYFSGTDRERLDDLQAMLDNRSVKAILCGRGGYGTSRIIDQLNFKKFKKHPKWIIGFSDVTVLHGHIHRNLKISTLHSPMAGAFEGEGYASEYVQSLRTVLQGKPTEYKCAPHTFNHKGEATGELVGGNLSIIAHLLGTASAFKTKHRILFLEDIGEQLYNIDRMLVQLKRNGYFDELAGLIIGGFTDMKDTGRPFGKSIMELIHEQVRDCSFPIAFGFPVSHGTENFALKIGGRYKLSVNETGVVLADKMKEAD